MAINKTERNKVRVQEPKVRAKNFEEVSLGFDDELACAEANRCLECKAAPCRKGCPVGVNIPAFIKCIKEGNLDAAVVSLTGDNNLPAICGRVCPQEAQCEKFCVRKVKLGGSVAIGALERYVADYSIFRAPPQPKKEIKLNGKSAAIVGSGPSSLTCAAELALAGYKVDIYEAFHKAGGVLVYGIPEFRLPKSLVQAEINKLINLGVNIHLNTIIGKTITLDELIAENDAVFLGSGAGLPRFLKIPGENLNGVYSANEYLTRVNLMKAYKPDSVTPIQVGKNVVVVGAGNVAMDSARTALRLGAENVYLVYRRSHNEMPARAEEIHHAEEEGIQLNLLTNPIEILGEDSKVKAIKCIKMELGEPDASGRCRPIPIKGSEFEFECDQVIVSVGTSPNPLLKNSCPNLKTTKWGTLVINEETGETSIDNVYAGGDAVTGAATVILAMGAGKLAAKSIIEKASK